MKKEITLNNGVKMPIIGLGTFKAKENECYHSVLAALKHGYRHIDTAKVYGNEEEVGRAIKDSGVPREEIFLTTKLWNTDQGYESAKKAFDDSCERLGVDYVDLYLIHWHKGLDKAKESWKAMEELYNAGKIKAIGVSNFTMYHIEKLLEYATVKPAINQVEVHIGLPQHNLQEYCMEKGIYLTAYAPMQAGQIFQNENLKTLSEKHGKSIANIALRYLVDRDIVIIPKSVKEERIISNKDIEDLILDEKDIEVIDGERNGKRIFPDPDNCYF